MEKDFLDETNKAEEAVAENEEKVEAAGTEEPEAVQEECTEQAECCEEAQDETECAEEIPAEAECAEEAQDEAENEADECCCEECADECEEPCECFAEDDEDAEDEDEFSEDDAFCPGCGVRRIHSYQDYCPACEARLKKTKIPFFAIIAGIVVLLASFVALILAIFVSGPSMQIAKGDMEAAKGNWFNAQSEYEQVADITSQVTGALGSDPTLSQLVQTGSGFKIKQFKAFAKVYSPLEAAQYADYIFGEGKTAPIEKDETYQNCKKIYDRYQSTYMGLEEPLTAIQTEEKPDGEKVLASMEELRGQDGIDDVFLDYFEFSVAGYCNLGNDTLLKYLEALDKDAKKSDTDYKWLYYEDYAKTLISCDMDAEAIPFLEERINADSSNYAAHKMMMTVYIKQGDFKKAKQLVETYSANNKTEGADSDAAYILRVYLLRCQGKLDEAMELAKEGSEKYATVAELLRQQALIYLVKGDYNSAYDKSFEAENTAYYMYYYYNDSSQMTEELNITLYVAANLCKKGGTYKGENAEPLAQVLDSFKGAKFPETATKIVKGDLTCKEVLTKGAYDFI